LIDIRAVPLERHRHARRLPGDPRHLRVVQSAEMLGVSIETIRRWKAAAVCT
jgi:uncharacterized protein YjcR